MFDYENIAKYVKDNGECMASNLYEIVLYEDPRFYIMTDGTKVNCTLEYMDKDDYHVVILDENYLKKWSIDHNTVGYVMDPILMYYLNRGIVTHSETESYIRAILDMAVYAIPAFSEC